MKRVAGSEVSQSDLDEVLGQTESLWQEVRGERIFFTGGSGFIGSWMVETFHHANQRLQLRARATVLTRDADSFRRKFSHRPADDISLVEGDILTFTMPVGAFAFVVHAAADVTARSSAGTEAALRSWRTLVAGTQRVLEQSGVRGVRKFLFTSSGAVYGLQPVTLSHVPESYTGAPPSTVSGSVYGEGKRAGELLGALISQQLGFECKIARIFATFGPRQPLDGYFAIGNFLADVLASRPPQIKGDGQPVRSYLYVTDLMVWLWTILFRGTCNDPYNAGSETGVSIARLAQLVAKNSGQNFPSINLHGDAPPRYVPDTSKARTALGLVERVSLDEGINRTLRWHKERSSLALP